MNKKMTILICEDDEMTLRATETKLKREGYNTIRAMDGKTAAAIIKENNFDLLITDMMMPYITGMELINYMKNELKIDKPIIAVTSISLENSVLKSFSLGADDYVVKPFSLNELAFRIKLILTRRYGLNAEKRA